MAPAIPTCSGGRLRAAASLLAAVVLGACNAQLDEASGVDPSGRPGAASGGAQGTGGGHEDASIDLSPDAGKRRTDAPYAELCGSGFPCTPGSSACVSASLDVGEADDTCQVFPSDEGPVAACVPAGAFGLGDPCVTAGDCAAGLGCVQANGAGVCRPYCCGDVELCPEDTYCAPQPMAEDAASETPLEIPACIPATHCELLNDAATCPPGLTCTIVRADGTTSCIEPGDGKLGASCPCAAGYVCAKLTDTCRKLCRIGHDELDCPNGGTCQGGSTGYPENIGICVGGENNQY